MGVEWTENLATGISVIDDQHKELFTRINGLLEACNSGKGKDAVAGVLSFLESYVIEHFAAEEKIQRDYIYPGYKDHKAIHDAFMTDVANLKQQFAEKGPSLTMVLTTKETVVDWLIHHIMKVDRQLGDYLKQSGYKGNA